MDLQAILAEKNAQKGGSPGGKVPPQFLHGKKKKKGNSPAKQEAIARRLAAMRKK
jgi:hypothetical protein